MPAENGLPPRAGAPAAVGDGFQSSSQRETLGRCKVHQQREPGGGGMLRLGRWAVAR